MKNIKVAHMNKICTNCQRNFEIEEADLIFLKNISPTYNGETFEVPTPTFCPPCRQQRRITWRNERSLYARECSKTGKRIIAMYPKSAPFPVYSSSEWWGDDWDPLQYGQDIDFDRPFFEQLAELRDKVPHFPLAVASTTMENSDYCNHAGYLKNCYLIYNSDYSEQCLYGKGVNRCFDCLDCYKVYECEALYECMNCYNCQFSTYLWDSHNTSDSHYSYNLIGCKNCFLSVNLQNQEYCIYNEKLTPQQYEKKVAELKENHTPEELLEMLVQFKAKFPMKAINEKNTENCTGDYLVNCKNCHNCYDSEYLENSKHCYDLKKGDGISYGNMDIAAFGVGVVHCYEGSTVGYNANHCLFGENVWECNDVHYSMLCVNNCKECFGCVGLKKQQYCILNKQYTKEDYEKMVAKLIRHMQSTGEWGEFLPTKYSPFSYNESMAQEYFPMDKSEVEAKGWKWVEKAPTESPNDPDVLICQDTAQPFKLQQREKEFYKKMDLPLPKYSPSARHLRRLEYRNPRLLNNRTCTNCQDPLSTTYTPETKQVLCHGCYLEKVF